MIRDVPSRQDAGRRLSVAVVGTGLIGSSLAHALRDRDHHVTGFNRSGAGGAHRALDLSSAEGQLQLRRLLDNGGFDVVVLVHGPTDVDWCEANESLARAVHVGSAYAASTTEARVVLVSTDAVFGTDSRADGDVSDELNPSTAYGRIKREAEAAVLAGRDSAIIRISVVYGWSGRLTHWNYGEYCLRVLDAGEALFAPTDQYFAPVYVTQAIAALGQVIETDGRGIAHLSGPQELSRYDFALLAAQLLGRPPSQVTGVPKALTRWASRPEKSRLRSSRWQESGVWAVRPVAPEEGLATMVNCAKGR